MKTPQSGGSGFFDVQVKQVRLLLMILLMSGVATAGQPAVPATDGPEVAGNWVDRSQQQIENVVQWLGRGTDRLLTGDDAVVENDSYLRIRLAEVLEEGGEHFAKYEVKLKIDLPKTEKRLQLVFDSDPDDFEELVEQSRTVSSDQQNLRDADNNDVSAALRWLMPVISGWRTSVDAGVRAKLPLDPFIRFRARRAYTLPDLWQFSMNHQLYYYHQRGLGQKSTLVFSRPLAEQWLLSNILTGQWRNKDDKLEFSHITALDYRPSDSDTLIWRAGLFYQENPRSYLESYFAEMTYRRRLYSDWLYGEVIPAVEWLRETDFDDDYSLTLRLDVIF